MSVRHNVELPHRIVASESQIIILAMKLILGHEEINDAWEEELHVSYVTPQYQSLFSGLLAL